MISESDLHETPINNALEYSKTINYWMLMPKWSAYEAAVLLELKSSPDDIGRMYSADDISEFIEAVIKHFCRFGLVENMGKEIIESRTHSPQEWIDCYKLCPDGRKIAIPSPKLKREQNFSDKSLLVVVAALLSYYNENKIPSAKDIEKAAQSLGVSISDDTIRKVIDAAKNLVNES